MKRYKTGVVIGKFLPFHLGHKGMIEAATRGAEVVTVIICHTDGYGIPPETRRDWIRRAFPDVNIQIILHDKRLDSVSTDVSRDWASKTIECLRFVPDVVFSSEDYGPYYAQWMGSDHVMYDRERKSDPVSGTQIRSDPFKHWDMIDNNVRAYYCKRIVVLGAESTGTTTLARDLAEHYDTVWVPEYGRLYASARMFGQSWDTNDFVRIAKMQNLMEDALAQEANKILICDTDSFATSIWHERYIGSRSRDVEDISSRRNVTLYILTDIDVPFEQDGTRDGEHIRKWMTQVFLGRLFESGRNYMLVSGSRERRVKDAIREIELKGSRE